MQLLYLFICVMLGWLLCCTIQASGTGAQLRHSIQPLLDLLACSFETHMQQNCLASVTQMPAGMDSVVVYNSSASCLPSWLKEATNSTVAQEAMPGARQDDLL